MYDVIIIGNDISSLTAAWQAAQRGLRTVLISDLKSSLQFTLQDYTFDTVPLPWPLLPEIVPGLCPVASATQSYTLSASPLQIIFPDHRVDLCGGLYDQIRELAREFPEDTETIKTLFKHVEEVDRIVGPLVSSSCSTGRIFHLLKCIPRLCMKSIQWRLNTRSYRRSDLGSVLMAPVRLFSNNTAVNLAHLSAAFQLGRLLKKPDLIFPAKRELLDSMFDQLTARGVVLYEPAMISKVLTGREIEVILQQDGTDRHLLAHDLIVSLKWKGFDALRQDRRIAHWYDRQFKDTVAKFYPHTLHLGISEKGVPESMAEHVILGSISNDPAGDIRALTFVTLSKPGDTRYAPPNKRALSATVFLEARQTEENSLDFKEIADNILKRLSIILPFLSENIDAIDIEGSARLSAQYHEVMSRKVSDRQIFPFPALRPSRTKAKHNVLVTGGELCPTLGFTGELLSGVRAANQLSGGKNHDSGRSEF